MIIHVYAYVSTPIITGDTATERLEDADRDFIDYMHAIKYIESHAYTADGLQLTYGVEIDNDA